MEDPNAGDQYDSASSSFETGHTSEPERATCNSNDINVLETVDNLNTSNAADSHKTIETFFAETDRISKTLTIEECDIGTSYLTSILRPYQRETVRWMIMRERERKELQLGDLNIILPSGGILADEMGLGKTVEMLACILANSKNKQINRPQPVLVSPKSNQEEKIVLGKRKSLADSPKSGFLEKKPRLSSIKQNKTLKNEITILLNEFFDRFKRKMFARRAGSSSETCTNVIEISFKVILLNRFFNSVKLDYVKKQIWGYMVSEYDVNQEDSISYSILQNEMQNSNDFDGCVSKTEVMEISSCVNEFLDEKQMKKFEKMFNLKLRYSLNVSAGEFIPLLEHDNVRCKCGSDKAKGKKVKCTKCSTLQHMLCIGLDPMLEVPTDYVCPVCWMNEPPFPSAATLIVVPPTLRKQWEEEISNHAADANLSIYCYEGVKNNYLLPPMLSSYDIVLVTFSTLRAELPYISQNSRALRHNKRYCSFVTPLTCVNWNRLCVDEAQMVESVNKTSEMTSMLKCVHKWAVTGTPIGKSLNDLYGLVTYLGMEPFTQSTKEWEILLSGDQSSLHTLFAHIMRRKTKNEVHEELRLPDLTVETTWMFFSPTEGFFYNSTHEASQRTFMDRLRTISDINQPLKKANRQKVESVLKPLLSLRQACVHPMVVKSKNIFNLRNEETMVQLLDRMIKKTKIDCDDILRLYVMYVNGAAAVHLAEHNYNDAILLYRSVMAKMKIYDTLTPDNFQMIHVMHNFCEAVSALNSIELTSEEKEYPKRIEELETKSLGKKQEMVTAMRQQLTRYSTDIANLIEKFGLKYFEWWERMLTRIDFSDILPRILEALETGHIEITTELKIKLSSYSRLIEGLKYWLLEVENKRDLTFLFLERISDVTTIESLWTAAINCHIRKEQSERTCLICRMENIMLKYEALIFNTGSKTEDYLDDNKANPIDWKMSAHECVLKVVLACSRLTGCLSKEDHIKAGKQIKALGLLKREFQAVRAVWSRQCDLLHVYDEIRMAKFTYDITNEKAMLDIDTCTAQQRICEFHEQSSSTYSKLQSKFGSLQYLKNLEKRYKEAENVEESCPICQYELNVKRAVFVCGHFICYGCMQVLIEHKMASNILCPVCREPTPLSSITYVHGGGKSDYDTSGVRGNYSIKILAVTAKVLELVKADPKVKILVFSTWARLLEIVADAFKENNISFQRFKSGQQRASSLTAFKNKNNINALLIPLHSGSKGLNITEASHIIFTEPALSIADEKQAVGRIYRLGQSKNMTVHKLLIRGTVEEHIHRMNEEIQNDANNFELTFKHLQDLFESTY